MARGVPCRRRAEDSRAEARALQSRSLTLFREVGDLDGMAESLDRFAMLARSEAELARAAMLFGAADGLHEAAGTTPTPPERDEIGSETAAVRAGLGGPEFEARWQAGRAMSRDAAVALALDGPSAASRSSDSDDRS